MTKRILRKSRILPAVTAMFCTIVLALPALATTDQSSHTPQNVSVTPHSNESGLYSYLKNLFYGAFGSSRSTFATEYSSALTADVVELNGPGGISLHGKAATSQENSLPGIFNLNLQLNPMDQTVRNGHWMRTIQETDADGVTTVVGTLHGEVVSGTVTWDAENGSATFGNIQLLIKGGSGNYAEIVSGSGTLAGTISNPIDQPALPVPAVMPGRRTFSGTMSLSF